MVKDKMKNHLMSFLDPFRTVPSHKQLVVGPARQRSTISAKDGYGTHPCRTRGIKGRYNSS